MCGGVAPSGLPMLMSMMSSPRRRAAILSSAVMLKTYGGRRSMRAKRRGPEVLVMRSPERERPEPSERRAARGERAARECYTATRARWGQVLLFAWQKARPDPHSEFGH